MLNNIEYDDINERRKALGEFNSYTTNNIKSTDAVKKGSDTFRGHFDITEGEAYGIDANKVLTRHSEIETTSTMLDKASQYIHTVDNDKVKKLTFPINFKNNKNEFRKKITATFNVPKNKNEIFSITQNVKQEAVKDAEWKETEKCKKIYKLYSNFLQIYL